MSFFQMNIIWNGSENVLSRKGILSIFILLSLALFLYLLTSSIAPHNGNDDEETVLFLGNEKIAPIIYKENGVAKGLVVDIAKGLGDKTGYRVVVNAIDWNAAQEMVLSEEADALLQINPSPEREKLYDFSDELLESQFAIFVESGSNIKNLNDLKHKAVGVEKNGYPYYMLQEYDEINIVTIPDWETAFKMLQSDALDALVVDRWIGEYELARSKIKGIVIADEPIRTLYSRIAVKKGNNELLDLINKGLKEMNQDGTMANIIKAWHGQRVVYLTRSSIRNISLYIIIGFLLLILLISLYWVNRFRKLSKKLELEADEKTEKLSETNELLRQANAELEKISMIDGLTNISNRRCFDMFLDRAWKMSMREKLPLALIMIDIDRFKLYNDTYGHLAGDECLKRVAQVVKNTVKKSGDFVARFGGEEFVVLLHNTNEEDAAIVAATIRYKVEELDISHERLNSVVTVSLGVAARIPNKDMTLDSLISAADGALYHSKQGGRNRVTRASSIVRIL